MTKPTPSATPKHTNRLAEASSPYLRQHMHNPVDWWPWSDEAFEAAKRQDKPIFLSVGYSTCHWCHVMEHESFEDEATAEILNQHFISVKLDREERPDLDGVYMTALQQVTGGGGWPMSILLDHERRPFFLATYLPPVDRYGRPGFKTILMRAADLWHNRRNDLVGSAEQIVASLANVSSEKPGDAPDATTLAAAIAQLAQRFDPASGGFGQKPKFPTPHVFSFLLSEANRIGSATASHMATQSLRKIARGGIHDHVGGGFHRYSTDAIWRLPHFEKMLYDQAQLAVAFLDAYVHSKDPEFADAARGIFRYAIRDLLDPLGGFHSAEDADSDGGEGRFYIFTLEELNTVLGAEDGARMAALFQCEAGGNYAEEATGHRDGTNILHLNLDPNPAPGAPNIRTLGQYQREIGPLLDKLLVYREGRERPRLDDKVQASWNGLWLSALVRGARVLARAPKPERSRDGDPTPEQLLDSAKKLARFVLSEMRGASGLWHTWRDGVASVPGFLDDYAFVAQGLLDLHQETLDIEWLEASVALVDEMMSLFEDRGESGEERLGYYFARAEQNDLLIRQKEIYDGAEPSGNSVAYGLLMRLGRLLGRAEYFASARGIEVTFGQRLRGYSSGHTRFMWALSHETWSPCEVTIVAGGNRSAAEVTMASEGGSIEPVPHPAAFPLLATARETMPTPDLLLVTPENRTQVVALTPTVGDMRLPGTAQAAAFVCRNGACGLAIVDVDGLSKALSGRS